MKNAPARLRATVPAVLWFILIMVLLSLPGKSFPTIQIWRPDKLAHIGLFGMQALLLWVALAFEKQSDRDLRKALVLAVALTGLFGFLSELYQHIFTTRMADIYDVLANWVGIILVFILIVWTGFRRTLSWAATILRLPESETE